MHRSPLFGPDSDPTRHKSLGEATNAMATENPRQPTESQPNTPPDAPAHYAFARASAVPNLGEDVLRSARHIRNAWRGLVEAEQDGTAEELVTRENLLRNEPPRFLSDITPANALSCLAAHLCLGVFPAKPEDGRYSRRDRATTTDQRRAQFYHAYRNLKSVAEAAAADGYAPDQVIGRFNAAVKEEMRRLRGRPLMGQGQDGEPNRLNAIANLLVTTYNRTRVLANPRGYRKYDAGNRLRAFNERLRLKYGEPAPVERVAEHVRDVLQGLSLDKTFGPVSPTGKRVFFDPAQLYTGRAERLGGRSINVESADAAAEYMLTRLGMRAIQYGNSVTDAERRRHLKLACEAFTDLADVLGIAEGDVSLGGRLAVAFGARGHGSALAHYEPVQRVINLTRKKGIGSLAHEWAHFFDNDLGTGEPRSYVSERIRWFREYGPGGRLQWVPGGEAVTPLQRAYLRLAELLRTCGFQDRLRDEVTRWAGDGRLTSGKVAYYRSASEVFARCFECHIKLRLDQTDRRNTYLSSVAPHPFWPNAEESVALAPALDEIFASSLKGEAREI
jgi:hypothetical protein